MDQNWPNSCPYYYVQAQSRPVAAGADIVPAVTMSSMPNGYVQMGLRQQAAMGNSVLLRGQASTGATAGIAGGQGQKGFASVVVPVGGIPYQNQNPSLLSLPTVPSSEAVAFGFGQSQSYRGNRAGVQVKMRQEQLLNKASNYLSRVRRSTPYNSKGRERNLLAEAYQLVAEMMPSYINNNYQMPAALPQMQVSNFDQLCQNQLQHIPVQASFNHMAPPSTYPEVHYAANQSGVQTANHVIYQTPSGLLQ